MIDFEMKFKKKRKKKKSLPTHPNICKYIKTVMNSTK